MARLSQQDGTPQPSKSKPRRRVVDSSDEEEEDDKSGSSNSDSDSDSGHDDDSEDEAIQQVLGSAIAQQRVTENNNDSVSTATRQLFPANNNNNNVVDALDKLSLGDSDKKKEEAKQKDSSNDTQKKTSNAPAPQRLNPTAAGFFAKLEEQKRNNPNRLDSLSRPPPHHATAKPHHTTQSGPGPQVGFLRRPTKQNNPKSQRVISNPRAPKETAGKPELAQPPESLPAKTYGSPTKSFDINSGSLFEPMTPKSKQWGQRVFPAHRKEIPASLPKVPNDPVQYYQPDNIWRAGPSTQQQGNQFGYISKDNAEKAIKDLVNGFDGGADLEDCEEEVSGLKVKLLPHQRRGVAFLRAREADNVKNKGGLLCDDMGLGKTVQSLALILSNQRQKDNDADEDDEHNVKGTLVVAPVALVQQWYDEVKNKAPKLRVLKHHGTSRTQNEQVFEDFDIVVTTYGIATSDHAAGGPLFRQCWWRIILDEAHTVKNHLSKSFKAVAGLKAANRWCLTGTPIQNNVDELYSLIHFLQVEPYNDYRAWKRDIGKEISSGRGQKAMKKLQVMLSMLMLRRTKAVLVESNGGGSGGFELPERRVSKKFIEFDTKEQEFYSKFEHKAGKRLQSLYDSGNVLNALLLLLRLRQICDHTGLVEAQLEGDDKEQIDASMEAPQGTDELADMLGGLAINNDLDEQQKEDNVSQHATSSKIREVLKILKADPARKTIVFSQFTKMMDLVEPCFKSAGIRYVRYDGSMRAVDRERSLATLRTDPDVTVLLCSLKCGALGLNLTCASQVVLVDPWWNPMVSEQAIDRVHRIGQADNVDVHELIMRNSVEERILKLQEKKRALAEGVFSGSTAKLDKLNKDEIMALFRM